MPDTTQDRARGKFVRLLFVRHGEPRDHEQGDDPPLTSRGRGEAERAGRRLASLHVDAIYSSTLRRAVETADIIHGYLPSTRRHSTSNLTEVSSQHYDYSHIPDDTATRAQLESERDAMERFANRIRHRYTSETIVVVCHADLIRSIIPILGHRNPKESILLEINHASVTELHVYPSGAVLVLANCVRHLADDPASDGS